MKKFDIFVYFLLAIAGVNWGLVGLFDFNLVEFLFRSSRIDTVVYVAIGIAGVYQIFGWKAICGRCRKK